VVSSEQHILCIWILTRQQFSHPIPQLVSYVGRRDAGDALCLDDVLCV
jgi:hypothetical protein